MKITMGDYEITVSAKHKYFDDRYNADAAKIVLNDLVFFLLSYRSDLGLTAKEDQAKRLGDELYDQLAAAGLYNNH